MHLGRRIHWTTHCLGIAGFLGIAVALQSLLSHDLGHQAFILFDLVFGLAELGMALFYLCVKDKDADR
jgi:hypothetical protein